NTGLGSTFNLVATLLEIGGVIAPGAPQTYGVVVAGGGAVTQAFTFTATNGFCGQTINPTFRLQDNGLDLGSITSSIALGPISTIFTQNFDGVTIPAFPSGWTASNSVLAAAWITTNNQPDTAPNVALGPDYSNVSTADLVSPGISLP